VVTVSFWQEVWLALAGRVVYEQPTTTAEPEPSAEDRQMRANHLNALRRIDSLVHGEHRRDFPDQAVIDALLDVRSAIAPAKAGSTKLLPGEPPVVSGDRARWAR
jgi:hypothetical protein